MRFFFQGARRASGEATYITYEPSTGSSVGLQRIKTLQKTFEVSHYQYGTGNYIVCLVSCTCIVFQPCYFVVCMALLAFFFIPSFCISHQHVYSSIPLRYFYFFFFFTPDALLPKNLGFLCTCECVYNFA